MFISTLDLNSCSAVLAVTRCGTASRYITGTPQKWKLYCGQWRQIRASTRLSCLVLPFSTPAPSAVGCLTFARLISSHAPRACLRFLQLNLEELCSEFLTWSALRTATFPRITLLTAFDIDLLDNLALELLFSHFLTVWNMGHIK